MLLRSKKRVWVPAENGIGRKSDYRKLERRGQFGNTLRLWPTLEDLARSEYEGWLRISNRKPSSPYKINEVHSTEINLSVHSLMLRGARLEDLVFGEVPAPNSDRFNFEAIRTPKYINLDWGTGKVPLREDLNRCVNPPASGVTAIALLRFFLGTEFEVLEDIWDRFPSSAIEATMLRKRIGHLHRRLVVWEAREY